jgi:hypothetical protein
MRSVRLAGLVAGLSLLFATSAVAAPVTVNLRLEGASTTHFEGPVTTDVRTVDGHDGTGAHTCDGTNNGQGGTPSPSTGAALAAAEGPFSWRGDYSAGFDDILLSAVNGESPDFGATGTFWGYYLNGQFASTGMCQTRLSGGEEILFAVANGSETLLKLAGPAQAKRGDAVDFTVTDAGTGQPVAGASVGGATSGADGKARVTLDKSGTQDFKATRAASIRSNKVSVCVADGDDGTCGTTRPPDAAPAPTPPASAPFVDRAAPLARLTGIAEGQRFAAGEGPRELKGSAPDPSGLVAVKLRLTRRYRGDCQYYSARRERLRDAPCGRSFWFKVGDQPEFSYLLPSALPAGRYVLDVKAIDKRFNRDETLQRGRNRVVFTVG